LGRQGDRPKGSDAAALAGVVTRVGKSVMEDFMRISIAVDGYPSSRVTLGAKSVNRE
jgi:hypothetical protein